MKRVGNLWDGMISFENLLRAAEKARRGKRFRPPAARFFFHLERELIRLHDELASRTYHPGPYRTFTVYEGKARLISAHAVPRPGGPPCPDRRMMYLELVRKPDILGRSYLGSPREPKTSPTRQPVHCSFSKGV